MSLARAATLVLGLAALGAAAAACEGGAGSTVVVAVEPGEGVDLARAVWAPEDAVVDAVSITPVRLELTMRSGPAAAKVSAPGACPATVDAAGASVVRLQPRLGVERPPAFVGHDAPFEIRVRFPCGDGQAVSWRQIAGPRVAFEVKEGGTVLAARTPPLAASEASHRWGLVALSHHASAPLTFEVSATFDGAPVERTVRVAAAPRSTGLPSLSVGQRVLLGGEGWTILSAPLDSEAALAPAPAGAALPLTGFTPDVAGRWLLADGTGHELALSAGRHDAMPLDCGRSDCHAAAAEAARHGPMTTVLHRGLSGALGASFDPSCAIECHAAGDPGLDDGFVATARALGVQLPSAPPGPGGWDALPSPLRRLGGVGCTACHGPSALPERSARWRIVRADVCAICHDAPPRYGHVAAWRASRMARSDDDPRTLSGGCARCHTSLGFLDWIGARSLKGEPVPERAGIACAACHAPHGASMPTALVRRVDPPASVGTLVGSAAFGPDAPSHVCLRCHAPVDGERAPAASAASLVLGDTSVHATIEGGCLGCHSAGPQDATLERGAGHAFRANLARCARCHEGAAPKERPDADGRLVADRARELWNAILKEKLARTDDPNAPHASVEVLAREGSDEARAVYDVLTVLEDPAAGIHGAKHARRLLDAAEARLRR